MMTRRIHAVACVAGMLVVAIAATASAVDQSKSWGGPYQDWIARTVEGQVGARSNLDTERIIAINFASDDTQHVVLSLVANDNLTINMVKRGMWSDAIKVFRALFGDSRVGSVTISWGRPMVDDYGNTQMRAAMAIAMYKSTAQRINWDAFLTENLPKVADAYEEYF